MKKFSSKKMTSLLLCMVLAAALVLTGCGAAETADPVETTAAPAETAAAADGEAAVLGEGKLSFNFVYEDLDGNETRYEIHTDKAIVGEALMDNELVSGTVGEWGLMVDTVGGLTLDFDKDGMYWAFFVDGEYAQTGVDSTEITEGAVYSFVPTKG